MNHEIAAAGIGRTRLWVYGLASIDVQPIIRMNRATLYSVVVVDLDAGPVTITLPDPGKRFLAMQIVDEDQYSRAAVYAPAKRTYTRKEIGTRYMIVGVRTLVDPNDPAIAGPRPRPPPFGRR